MSFTFEDDDGIDVQSTLDIHLSPKKSKSLDNINFNDSNLNSCSSSSDFKRGDVEYTGITIGIPSIDYDFIYGRFENCLGNTQTLLEDYFEECIVKNIESIRDDDCENFREEISLPRETMRKVNGMMYYHETKDGGFHPISFGDFIVMMVDELYEIRRDSYEERGERLSQILEGVDVEQ